MSEDFLLSVNSIVFGVWFLIGAALVFWMQAGFAIVYRVDKVVKIRTGEENFAALNDVE